jgi:hypothetical protein
MTRRRRLSWRRWRQRPPSYCMQYTRNSSLDQAKYDKKKEAVVEEMEIEANIILYTIYSYTLLLIRPSMIRRRRLSSRRWR